MGRRKKGLIAVAVLFLVAAVCAGGYFGFRAAGTASTERYLKEERGIELPEKRSPKYQAWATHQDGHDMYAVYLVQELPPAFRQRFTAGKNVYVQRTMEDIIEAVKAGGWLAPRNRVPKKYQPDFAQTYLFCISPILQSDFFVSGYCMVYFPDSSLLLVCERAYR